MNPPLPADKRTGDLGPGRRPPVQVHHHHHALGLPVIISDENENRDSTRKTGTKNNTLKADAPASLDELDLENGRPGARVFGRVLQQGRQTHFWSSSGNVGGSTTRGKKSPPPPPPVTGAFAGPRQPSTCFSNSSVRSNGGHGRDRGGNDSTNPLIDDPSPSKRMRRTLPSGPVTGILEPLHRTRRSRKSRAIAAVRQDDSGIGTSPGVENQQEQRRDRVPARNNSGTNYQDLYNEPATAVNGLLRAPGCSDGNHEVFGEQNDEEMCDKENKVNEMLLERSRCVAVSESAGTGVPTTNRNTTTSSDPAIPAPPTSRCYGVTVLTGQRIVPAAERTVSSKSSSADLNGSFTEKISNLDIGEARSCGVGTVKPNTEPTRDAINERESRQAVPQNNVVPERRGPNPSRLGSRRNWMWVPEALYSDEILNYWHRMEQQRRVDPAYMGKQREVSFKMRTILVDWLVEVVEEYSVGNSTLHRAVHFIDRYLSSVQVTRSNLQLVGTASLFIASKLEEIHPPDTSELAYITDNTYTRRELVHMERLVLSTLEFDHLLTPTAHEFTVYFSHVMGLTETAHQCANYLSELTLLHGERFLGFEPSTIALAACYVAVRCCGCDRGDWTPETRNYHDENPVNNDDDDERHDRTGNRTRLNTHSQALSAGHGHQDEATSNPNNRRTSSRGRESSCTVSAPGSVPFVLSRIPRLNLTVEFIAVVEKVVCGLFFVILNQSASSSGSSSSSSSSSMTSELIDTSGIGVTSTIGPPYSSSVATKYKQFQNDGFLAAAASTAACLPMPHLGQQY